MANFHTNRLVIAADEENMCKVLVRMAENLAANKEYTNFDLANIAGLTTARDLYYQVGGDIDASYIFVFAGAPLPEGVQASGASGWSSPTSSEDGFMQQLAALMGVADEISEGLPEGVSVSIAQTAPTGRGLSDTAIVNFTRYGENWTLAVEYSTAWTPNSEDLDVFFMGLPKGDYGVAFLDADEYDGYESVNFFGGLHHGLAGMQAFDGGGKDCLYESSDLKAEQRGAVGVSKSEITDLAKLAEIVAIGGWSEFGWDEDESDYGYSSYGDDGESVSLWDRPPVNWRNPTPSDVKLVISAVVDVFAACPIVLNLNSGWSKEGNDAVESLLPGDEVVVTGEWGAMDFAALHVSSADGAKIGNAYTWMGISDDYQVNRIAVAVVALLLPHFRATVLELTPVSMRN